MSEKKKYNITLMPGDGIGPEISKAVQEVIAASGVDIEWDMQLIGMAAYKETGDVFPEASLKSIQKNKVAMKGPIENLSGKGERSASVKMRKALDAYANLRPAKTLPNVKSRYEDIDLVIVRENTEDLYSGVEHMVGEDAAESIKIITRKGSERIVKFAFDYAVKHNRKKVTAVHKANIMKLSDGLFLEVAEEVAKSYPQIEFEDRIVDNMCMQLVQKPELYDVLVMGNLYGDILSDLCAGLIGGLGVAPGANIGKDYAVFEAVHGSAPKYTGLNVVNPIAFILSSVMMLEHLGEFEAANSIRQAIIKVLTDNNKEVLTKDLGGTGTTTGITQAIISELK